MIIYNNDRTKMLLINAGGNVSAEIKTKQTKNFKNISLTINGVKIYKYKIETSLFGPETINEATNRIYAICRSIISEIVRLNECADNKDNIISINDSGSIEIKTANTISDLQREILK